jgi:hypothetical protein
VYGIPNYLMSPASRQDTMTLTAIGYMVPSLFPRWGFICDAPFSLCLSLSCRLLREANEVGAELPPDGVSACLAHTKHALAR